MRVFEHVALEGSFAAAARKLDLSPAVATRLVADLEQYLGVRLLQRTTRRLSLTSAGEDYLVRLRQILGDIEEAEAAAHAHSREVSGTVRVLALTALATHVIAPAIGTFQRRYPKVHVDIHAEDFAEPEVDDYDLTLVTSHLQMPGTVIVRPVLETEAVLCASPEYLHRHGEPATVEDLRAHRFIRVRLSGLRPRPMTLMDPDGRQVEAAGEVIATTNHTDAVLRATLDGAGLSSQSVPVLAPYLKTGQLRRVLAPWSTDRFSVLAALPSRKFLPARTRAFLDHLVEQARQLAGSPQA